MTKTTQTTTKRTKSTSKSSKRSSSKAQRTERPEGAEIKEQKRRKEQPKVQLHPPYLYPSHILESELEALPLAKCPVPLHVITDKEEARKAIAKIRRPRCLGRAAHLPGAPSAAQSLPRQLCPALAPIIQL